MPDQDDLTKTCTQLTQRQLQAALLEITSDLPKAEVLQKRLPGWMINENRVVDQSPISQINVDRIAAVERRFHAFTFNPDSNKASCIKSALIHPYA